MELSSHQIPSKISLLKHIIGCNTFNAAMNSKTTLALFALFGECLLDALSLIDKQCTIRKLVNVVDTSLFLYRIVTPDQSESFTIIPKVYRCTCSETSKLHEKDAVSSDVCHHILCVILAEKLNRVVCCCYSNDEYCEDVSQFKIKSLISC